MWYWQQSVCVWQILESDSRDRKQKNGSGGAFFVPPKLLSSRASLIKATEIYFTFLIPLIPVLEFRLITFEEELRGEENKEEHLWQKNSDTFDYFTACSTTWVTAACQLNVSIMLALRQLYVSIMLALYWLYLSIMLALCQLYVGIMLALRKHYISFMLALW